MRKPNKTNYKEYIWNLTTELQKASNTYAEDKSIREKIKQYAKLNYIQDHPKDRYINFIRKNLAAFSIEEIPPKSEGSFYVYRMFCAEAHAVFGNSLEECIDIAIEKKKNHFI